jgi:hypothetical protein
MTRFCTPSSHALGSLRHKLTNTPERDPRLHADSIDNDPSSAAASKVLVMDTMVSLAGEAEH